MFFLNHHLTVYTHVRIDYKKESILFLLTGAQLFPPAEYQFDKVNLVTIVIIDFFALT